ncbi:FAD-dependent oxidoreductase [Acinetobacter sp. B10A]|uniref:flavin monoamine oxidase family protein n=1 Tax=Acinetobacter baretiae TaxID=2605383 RepID=UPI001B3C9647|nr:NAD(P)/FAD-dependent oxidoreductase [Acinetobacter baretiae]MBF7684383.1 FAD-dependent oxidoreductase [Acinetobacter baretiae]
MLHQKPIDLPILVVGAGIAGLSCAQTLKNAGKNVVLLEAQTRLGGRIHSQCIKNNYFDLGASWIHGIKHNPIWDIVQKHHITTQILNDDHSNYIHNNKQPFSELEKKVLLQYVEKIQQYLKTIPTCSALDAINTYLSTFNYQGNIFTESELKNILLNIFQHLARDPFATDLEFLASNYSEYEGYFEGDEVIFPKGYDQIINIMADTLNIKTACEITNINYNEFSVEVIDQEKNIYRGSHVIITVPLGVLKKNKICFHPSLPKDCVDAIQHVGFGSFNKVFFELDQPIGFIPTTDTITNTFYWTEQNLFNLFDLSTLYKKPTYLMLLGGQQSNFVDHATDREVWSFVLKSLEYGTDVQPKQLLITRWGIDPYSHGSFSFPTPQHSPKYTDTLNTPIKDRVFFAGEHCSLKYSGTVHGAYISGQNTAFRLLQTL